MWRGEKGVTRKLRRGKGTIKEREGMGKRGDHHRKGGRKRDEGKKKR